MTVTWQHEAAVVVGFRSARACWTGQWPQPLSHGMESPCRLSYVSHSSQSFPNLPFLVFSNFPILRSAGFFCLLGPDEAKYAASVPCLPCLPPSTVPSLPTGLLYRNHTFLLPAVRVTLLPPSSSSFRQLQLFQWIDHNVFVTSYSPATRTIHSVGQRPRRPARQRHAVLPPSRGPRHKSISHPWCVLSTRLPAFPRCSPGSFPEA